MLDVWGGIAPFGYVYVHAEQLTQTNAQYLRWYCSSVWR